MHATERLWQEMAAAVGPAVSIRPDVVMVGVVVYTAAL